MGLEPLGAIPGTSGASTNIRECQRCGYRSPDEARLSNGCSLPCITGKRNKLALSCFIDCRRMYAGRVDCTICVDPPGDCIYRQQHWRSRAYTGKSLGACSDCQTCVQFDQCKCNYSATSRYSHPGSNAGATNIHFDR